MKAQPMKDAPRDGTPILVKDIHGKWAEASWDKIREEWNVLDEWYVADSLVTAWAPRPEEE